MGPWEPWVAMCWLVISGLCSAPWLGLMWNALHSDKLIANAALGR